MTKKTLRAVLLAALLTQLRSHALMVTQPDSSGRNAHWILQFKTLPGASARRQLARRGIRVLEDVGNSGLIASFRGSSGQAGVDLTGLDIAWTGQLTPADRTAPGLDRAATFLVVFHGDVDRKTAVGLLDGFKIQDAAGLPANRFLVAADLVRLPRLAALDEVSCILPRAER